jgi:malic enzyme
MMNSDYELDTTRRDAPLRISARGRAVLANPMTNRGTAFTVQERRYLGLVGLMPSEVTPIGNQVRRVYQQYHSARTPFAKNNYLASLRDRNEVLFYRLLADHIEEMLPIIYTPTIGEVIERFSVEYHRPRGVFISIDRPEDIEQSLLDHGLAAGDVDLIVATDSEGILGIGDQGIGGIEIAIGKLSVYTAAAGIHPRRVMPVVLDVGTDNLGLLNSDLYLGERHARVRGERYDEFIDTFVKTATRLFPQAMLHWEDFGAGNAHRILEKYRHTHCTFNDDIQGTAAVALAAVLAGVNITGMPLADHRIVIFGGGTAGIGIADLLARRTHPCRGAARGCGRSVLCAGEQGAVRRRHADAPGVPAALRPVSRRGRPVEPRRRLRARDPVGRRRPQRPPDDHDRDLDDGRGVHQGHRQGHGGALRTADHHAAVQPDLPRRGHGQPTSSSGPTVTPSSRPAAPSSRSTTARCATSSPRPTTPSSSLGWARGRRVPGDPGDRPDDRGRRGGARRAGQHLSPGCRVAAVDE